MKHLCTSSFIIIVCLISTSALFSQASNYFPNSIGTTWTYDAVMLGAGDTVMPGSEYREVDSIASFSAVDGKDAYMIQSRLESGVPSGSSYFAFEGANALAYLPSLPPPLDTMIDAPPPQWLTSFKFNSTPVIPWTIFDWDTTITLDTITFPIAIRISGERVGLNDIVDVPAGSFTAARFNIIEQIGTKVFNIFVPLFSMVDTFWIVQKTWIVKHSRSAVSVEVPTGTDTISLSIPGVRRELIAFNPNVVNEEDVLPQGVRLFQNYPNPFNPSTVMSYQLPVNSWVTIKIYNTLGEEVATLVDGHQVSGYRFAEWNASGMSSGIYHVRMTAGNFSDVRKIVLLK
jgi:hypothetical protein